VVKIALKVLGMAAVTLAMVAGIFLIGFVFLTDGKLPEADRLQVSGWHDGSEPPASSLIGKPLSYLKIEYFPLRYTQQTAYYLIRGGLGGWYMSLGYNQSDDMPIGLPDNWIEYPKETP
jgi:hypothetical protein